MAHAEPHVELNVEEVMPHVHKLFAHYDHDGDGKIDMVQYLAVNQRIATLLGATWDDTMKEGLEEDFRAADKEGTSLINFDGLCADTIDDFKSMGISTDKAVELLSLVIQGLEYQDVGGDEAGHSEVQKS
eukprot:TRINITY_DN11928_c0_g1_i2.p1 TRINITY_DN11928_c0_g1~~TRINITY_DN11928_c0_g1_i2.p1  ORF type:complete len:130 (+),score=36.15 TRINITY_DN11928_c0_g1_i2:234-623(+)